MADTIATGQTRTITAIFDTRTDAESAVQALLDEGFTQNNVRLVEGNEQSDDTAARSTAHQGFFDKLADFFMPSEDRYSYAEGLSRGGYLVTVTGLDSTTYEQALDIVDREGAVNLDEREANWRSEGWQGYQPTSTATGSSYGDADYAETSARDVPDAAIGSTTASAYGAGTTTGTTAFGTSAASATGYNAANTTLSTTAGTDEEIIPVVEEELQVGKRDVNNGRVRVRSYVREEPVSETLNLRDERVSIERRPVDRPLSAADQAFTEKTIEAEEHSEQPVVSKEARVVEEITLRKDQTERQETVSDTVRKTEIDVEDERGTSGISGTGTFGSTPR